MSDGIDDGVVATNRLEVLHLHDFSSKHLDAREVFHRAARIDLHPDADGYDRTG
ncbi:hypothetical protein B0G75_13919 [Paraburkholderia sp. BL18I3N2]|uniref:hypothetical protein n=1 Tax=Paraburkholderia sp. BL18I3N2 TaxID=1938799 RepID=UPI000D469739|nr:hypothetical protein [Paraburkholderia sp. BL18I3N2]PRX19156.1 hypothetical protein B0G75_13919 [Paraburkholderia sp. BL18I3N2]